MHRALWITLVIASCTAHGGLPPADPQRSGEAGPLPSHAPVAIAEAPPERTRAPTKEPVAVAVDPGHSTASSAEPSCIPRRAGGLTIPCDPPIKGPKAGARLRSHVEGCLSHNCARTWAHGPVPGFIQPAIGTKELFLLDETPHGWMALYRDPYGAGSCTLSGPGNCDFVVRVHDPTGKRVAEIPLNAHMSRTTRLEVTDARMDRDTLYFNESCQSYSKEAGRKCSALLAVDIRSGKKKWRTGHLVSNRDFAVLDDHVVAGYGFTNEKPSLSVIRKSDGKVTWTRQPPRSHRTMSAEDGSTVRVTRTDGKVVRYSVTKAHGVRRIP